MISKRILLLQLSVPLVFAVSGSVKYEVKIKSPADLLCTNCQEVICTLYSIEPEKGFTKFIKYIAGAEQATVNVNWTTHLAADTLEECGDYAVDLDAEMFFFDNGICQTSDYRFKRLPEPCDKLDAKFVYMKAGRAPPLSCTNENVIILDGDSLLKELPRCDVEWWLDCDDGSIVNRIERKNGTSCTPKTADSDIIQISSGYLFTFDISTNYFDQFSYCSSYGASVCAPKTEDERAQFVQDVLGAFSGKVLGLPLNSTYPFTSYTWSTGIEQPIYPLAQNGWMVGAPVNLASALPCTYVMNGNIMPLMCGQTSSVCCYVQDED